MDFDKTLHEKLTNLLMDAGASVTKKSIDELVLYIANRDQSILNRVIKDAEKTLIHLQLETKTIGSE